MRKRTRQFLTFLLSFMLMLSTINVSAAEISGKSCSPAVTVTAESTGSATDALEVENNIEPEAAETAVNLSEFNTPDDTIVDIVSLDYIVDESGLVWYSNEPEESAIQTFGLEDRYTVAPPTTYQEVHDRIMAFQEVEGYKEGTTWTNYEPYGEKGEWGIHYRFQGGKVLGAQYGIGCAAFAFEMSDAAFGDLPARTITDFTYDMVRVGDILYQGTHFVIVTMISPGGVVVAEGNYNKSVHWGRVISAAAVESASFIITRYPEGFVSGDAEFYDKVVQSGTENDLDWTLTGGGTLTISGNGAIPNYIWGSTSPSWNAYASSIGAIVIEEGVTGIGNHAFRDSKATMVCLPDGLTGIGECAFRNANITDITIPASVQVVGNSAFAFCSGLVSAHFMSGTARVTFGENLFTQCWELLYVTLPEHADCISGGMFAQCIQLPYLYIPRGIESIESVNSMAGSPFMKTDKLTCIEFGGTAEEWNAKGGNTALQRAGLDPGIMKFGIGFVDPFVPSDNDPDDLIIDPCQGNHIGTADENGNCTACGKPMTPASSDPADPSESTEPTPNEHEWDFSLWSYDDKYHWHECIADDCPVSDNSLKAGYTEHNFGEWVVAAEATISQDGSQHRDCSTCSYRQTEVIPATGDNGDDSNNVGDADESSNTGDTDDGSNVGDTDDSGQSGNTGNNGGNGGSSVEPGQDPTSPSGDISDSSHGDSDHSGDDSNSSDNKQPSGGLSGQGVISSDDGSNLPPDDSFATVAVALLALCSVGGLGVYFRTPIRKLIATLLPNNKR